jgi:6-phosphofructokinase 1
VSPDASGNKKLPPIGEFLKDAIGKYFKEHDLPSTVKYIDPSYMVRSVAANAADSIYCSLLAQNAVHGAMAGFTQFTVVSPQHSHTDKGRPARSASTNPSLPSLCG